MSGTGAMFGALDVGLYITKSENGARRLRVELEARDFATPDPLGVVITGTGNGEHGGFTYLDTARMELDARAAEDRDLAAELETLLADGQWRTSTSSRANRPASARTATSSERCSPEHPNGSSRWKASASGDTSTHDRGAP